MGERHNFVAREVLPEEHLGLKQYIKDYLRNKAIEAIYDRSEFGRTYTFNVEYSEQYVNYGYISGIEMAIRGYIEDISNDPPGGSNDV